MHTAYAQELIAVILQLKRQQELSINELNNHLGAIAGQLERIANDIAINVHERDRWKGDK
jgi:hypothetical protein